MIQPYINKLIKNLPKQNKPLELDLVLDGGVFNGSYLIGSMYFLKELENINYVKIKRISGCSVGSAVGILYALDKLNMSQYINKKIIEQLKNNYKIPIIKDYKNILFGKKELSIEEKESILNKVNNFLYVTYYKKSKNNLFFQKVIKKNYTTVDDIFDCILRSCYIPFFIDGNLLYKDKYLDGITPYIFNKKKNRKILYLNLCNSDKLMYMINIKNEQSDFHRILTGLLDIHLFFIKHTNTSMCSYVNEWTFFYKIKHQYFKYLFEYVALTFLTICLAIYKKYLINLNSNVYPKEISNLFLSIKDVLFYFYKIILKKNI